MVQINAVTDLRLSKVVFFTDIGPVVHPIVVKESLVSRFRYWNESVQEGMYFNHDLYTYFRCFSAAHRLNAYAAAYDQIEQGNTVCLTASETHYIIWLCLRAHRTVQRSAGGGPNGGIAQAEQEVYLGS